MTTSTPTTPSTRVLNLVTGQWGPYYTLEPAQAVVAAHEQQTRGNYNTWDYPEPQAHPEFTQGSESVCCGDWAAMLDQSAPGAQGQNPCQQAHEAGYLANQAGQPLNSNPHPDDSPLFQAWGYGWMSKYRLDYEAARRW